MRTLEAIRADLTRVNGEIDNAYWTFCANCVEWALTWRAELLTSLTVSR